VQEFLLVLFLDHLALTFLLLLAVAVVVEVVALLKPEVEEELVVYVLPYLQLEEEQVLNQAFLLVTEVQPLLISL
jgi:predicted nucleotide-binding protein (sugar kinase/HSP70/actin superfamily)